MLGDAIELWPGFSGVVVCDLDNREFSEAFTEEDWQHLTQGVLVQSKTAGLIHLEEPSADLKRIQQKDQNDDETSA